MLPQGQSAKVASWKDEPWSLTEPIVLERLSETVGADQVSHCLITEGGRSVKRSCFIH